MNQDMIGNLPKLAQNLFEAARSTQLRQQIQTELRAEHHRLYLSSQISQNMKALMEFREALYEFELSIRGARQFLKADIDTQARNYDATAHEVFLRNTARALKRLRDLSDNQYLKSLFFFRSLIEHAFVEYPVSSLTSNAFPRNEEIKAAWDERGIWGAMAHHRQACERVRQEKLQKEQQEKEARASEETRKREIQESIRRKLSADERKWLREEMSRSTPWAPHLDSSWLA